MLESSLLLNLNSLCPDENCTALFFGAVCVVAATASFTSNDVNELKLMAV